MKVAIIGAGPAGITAAQQLASRGTQVVVFEKEREVGGLSRTIELWDQKVDLGPHRFFTAHPLVKDQWFRAIDREYRLVNRQTRIYYRGRLFSYPLKPANVLRNLGLTDSVLCISSYLRQQLASPNCPQATFESWVSARFGRRLYEKFFKTYSEKLWGIPCAELDSDFALQRIRGFSMWEALKSMAKPKGARHRTLVDEFAYPTAGAGMAYEQMAKAFLKAGGCLRTSCPVQSVIREGTAIRGIQLEDGSIETYDHVISSMDLLSLLRGLRPLSGEIEQASSNLKFRNTVIVYLQVGSKQLFPDQWIYMHNPDLLVGRITNFRNWVPELYGKQETSILAMEYWCNTTDTTWTMSEHDLVALAMSEIRKSGLLGNARILDGKALRIQGSYPVYRAGYRQLLKPIIHFLSGLQGLTVIGRSGTFKYNNQDHSILMGMMAAENILHGAAHDLWNTNTESEYQESGNAFSSSEKTTD